LIQKIKDKQAGFSAIFVIAAILVVAVIAGAGFVVFKKSADAKQATTTATVPGTTETVEESTPEPEQPVAYEGFTHYTNEKYEFSFYYPNEWRVEERDPSLAMDTEKTLLSLWLIDTAASHELQPWQLRSLDRDLESVSAGIDGFAIAGAGPGPGTARQRPVLASRPRDAHTEPQPAGHAARRIRPAARSH
jgi:hypothetical protein